MQLNLPMADGRFPRQQVLLTTLIADGSKVLIMLTALEMVELEDVGKRRLPMSHFVGIVPADGSSKTPEKLVPGNALFWSQDGMAFYYMGPEGFARYDVLSKASTLITLPQGYSRIFGEVQTEDVMKLSAFSWKKM